MRIKEICTKEVVTCERDATAVEMARLMRRHHVGDLVVIDRRDEKPVPAGIVTDRDLVVEVLAAGIAPVDVTAGDLMHGELVTAIEGEYVYDAIWHMRSKGVRRLPVVDAKGVLVGVLTTDDVSRFLASEFAEVVRIGPQQMARERTLRTPVPG